MRGMQLTGGSASIRTSWLQYRELGARARAMLVEAAARRWQLPAGRLSTREGRVFGPGGHEAGYGELAEAAIALPVPARVTLKQPRDFRLIGQPATRLSPSASTCSCPAC